MREVAWACRKRQKKLRRRWRLYILLRVGDEGRSAYRRVAI